MKVLLKRIGNTFAFIAGDIVVDSSTEAVGRTGNIEVALALGSSVENNNFVGRKYRRRAGDNPSHKVTALGCRTRRRGGQHYRSDGY